MSNPFFYGGPVSPDQFIDRLPELRRIVGRIINHGQSTAIVGEPRSGKTSMLSYVTAAEAYKRFYGPAGKRLLFSFIDAQTLGRQFDQAQFWEYALRPLHERVIARDPVSSLVQAYELCRQNNFGCFVLERLLAQVGAENWRLVLLLDEFDVLLHHPVLNSAEFFGSLRSLASRSRGALVMIIASRHSLTSLNDATHQFSCTGSPYFNFLDEITLGPLPPEAIAELLLRAGDRFTADDCRFIEEVAGGYPYLLQVAASELWESYAEKQEDPGQRWQRMGHKLYGEAGRMLGDTWRLWSPMTRRVFAAVALASMNALERGNLHVKHSLRDMRGLEPELRLLKEQGFVVEDENIRGGWRVRPQVFLWWLADELARMVRHRVPFEEWLQKQELGSLLTRDEKEQWGKVVQTLRELLQDGVKALIEVGIKGIMEAMTGA